MRRDEEGLIRAEVTVVPARVRPGRAVRIHVVLRPDANHKAHWNNEAEPLRLWIDLPDELAGHRTLAGLPRDEAGRDRGRSSLDFEMKAPAQAQGKVRFSAYALYHVCDDAGGQCRFLRLDIPDQSNHHEITSVRFPRARPPRRFLFQENKGVRNLNE